MRHKLAQIPPVFWVVLILLLAVWLRVYGIYRISPPGLEHDEVANWLIDRAILDGNHALYFTEAYGHEAGFHYLQAMSLALFGDHALALRLPAAFAGLLLVALHYALIRRLFGFQTALISTAFLAVLFWPVFYSRLGLRAILLPLVSGFSLICWWKAWYLKPGAVTLANKSRLIDKLGQRPAFWFALAGMIAGLSLYTYMAARAVPIFFALFMIYLVLFHRTVVKLRWRGIFLFLLLFAATAAPLIIFFQTNPGAEFRISEIDAPLQALAAGDLRPAMMNGVKILGMFGLSGDPLWRQNVAGRPIFGPLLAILFYAGLTLAIWRWKNERFAFLLLWLGSAAIPSVVTVDAPSSIRMINGLLVVTVFPALIIHNIPRFSTVMPRLSTAGPYLLAFLLVFAHIWWTVNGVFHMWPENDEVQFVWQEALTETAAYLDQSNDTSPITIAGWSPATLDPSTMLLSMRRTDLDMRFTGSDSNSAPINTLIVPGFFDGEGARIARPSIREIAPELEEQLANWGAAPQQKDSFVLYEVPSGAAVEAQVSLQTSFDEQLQFLGYSIAGDSGDCLAGNCRLVSYWQVDRPADNRLSFFLHAVDDQGVLLAQDDGLDAPAQYWQAGDLLVQVHALHLDQEVPVEIRLGIYDPQSGRRLLLVDGQDHLSFALP